MNIEDEVQINKYGQGLIDMKELLYRFEKFDFVNKQKYLIDVVFLILQSKTNDDDIDEAIRQSNLRPTFTPCIMIRKGGVNSSTLKIITSLPENEYLKVFALFIALFKIGYQRRFLVEKNDPNKWWYWDLSEPNIMNRIQNYLHR